MIAGRLLVWAKARVRDRENLRFERTRVFGRVRRIVRGLGDGLAVCGRIEDPRDVFLLTLDEVLGAIEGAGATEDLAGLAAVRRAEMLSFTLMPDPPSRLEKRGAAAARGVDRVADGEHGDERSGLGCSRGRVAGSARVVRDPRQDVVQRGEIMVARHTDPGWIALFANAAGIVTERGSLLSHSAIVAREMGIPCVVALKGALDWIATGDRIEIDGQRGTVRKLDA